MRPAARTPPDDSREEVPVLRLEDMPPPPPLPLLLRLYTHPRLRQALPLPVSFALARLRAELVWRRSPGARAEMIDEMRLLLERSERAQEIPDIARRHACQVAWLGELNWRTSVERQVPVQGVEHIQAARADGAVLVHYMHFGPFAWIASVLSVYGVQLWAVVSDVWLGDAPGGLLGHKAHAYMRTVLRSANAMPATGAAFQISQLLKRGEVVGLASDLPGTLPASFLGRQLEVSPTIARMALRTGTPIVCLTWHDRGPGRLPLMRLHPPIDPRQYEDPVSLEAAVLAVHEPAVLEWPEAMEKPSVRWNLADDEAR